jgi:hypothetical protein
MKIRLIKIELREESSVFPTEHARAILILGILAKWV